MGLGIKSYLDYSIVMYLINYNYPFNYSHSEKKEDFKEKTVEQFIIFCFCFYVSLLTTTFIYNCINGIRLNNLNIDKRKKLLAKSDELIKLNFEKIDKLKPDMEDKDFEIKLAEIKKNRAEIEKCYKELDKLDLIDKKTLNKINNYNKSIELFLAILTFGIYKKEEL